MARDVIISAFATPPQAKMRALAQNLNLFKDTPLIIDVNGIGSDVWKGPDDISRKPREPWGGKPFAREAAMYRQRGGGSVLRGLINAHMRSPGDDPRRIAIVAFSAGGTFAHKVLEEARHLIDTVILLDALHIAKTPNGKFSGKDAKPWIEFASKAALAGCLTERTDLVGALKGPVFVSAHTAIKQSADKERLVGNTTASTQAVWRTVLEREPFCPPFEYPLTKLRTSAPDAFPVTIGPSQGVPPPAKTWTSMPVPVIDVAVGNMFALNYGGTGPADHVLQAWHIQRAIWETFLAPRWNAGRTMAVASLRGMGADTTESDPRGVVVSRADIEALRAASSFSSALMYTAAAAAGAVIGSRLASRG